MKKIAAVVVTYNRLELLKRILGGLQQQTRQPDAIIVVNNGSTDGSTEWLNSQPGLRVTHQANGGSAAGFHTGLAEAVAAGYDYAWIMDDDGFPEKDCLEKLTSSEAFRTVPDAVVSSMTLNPENHSELSFAIPEMNSYNKFLNHWGKRTNKVSVILAQAGPLGYEWGIFFNSNLIPANVIKKAGLPRSDFFIWGDEYEYYSRIGSHHYKFYMIPGSVFYHPASGDSIWTKTGAIPQWKEKFLVRNYTYVNKKYKRFSLLHHTYMLLRIVQFRKTYLLKPFWHGLINNFSHNYLLQP